MSKSQAAIVTPAYLQSHRNPDPLIWSVGKLISTFFFRPDPDFRARGTKAAAFSLHSPGTQDTSLYFADISGYAYLITDGQKPRLWMP